MSEIDIFTRDDESNPLLEAISSPNEVNDIEISGMGQFDLSTSEGVHQMVGAFKTMSFMSQLNNFMRAQVLQGLKSKKKYSIAGVENFKGLCALLGISERTGRTLTANIEVFGLATYKDMQGIGLKSKHLEMLKRKDYAALKPGDAGTEIEITVRGETHQVPLDKKNKPMLVELLKQKEKEQAALKEAAKIEKERREETERKLQEFEEPAILSHDEKAFSEQTGKLQYTILQHNKLISNLKEDAENSKIPEIKSQYRAFLQWFDETFTGLRENLDIIDEDE